MRLVLWRTAQGAWSCFEDKCPHRLAPLSGNTSLASLMPPLPLIAFQQCTCLAVDMFLPSSAHNDASQTSEASTEGLCGHAEGRIEPSDGTLMCSYHGWRFKFDGKCIDIPQALDEKANATACSNQRSCAIARPTKVSWLPSSNDLSCLWQSRTDSILAAITASCKGLLSVGNMTTGWQAKVKGGQSSARNAATWEISPAVIMRT